MKYARLIVANLFRKKTRTTLTVGSFAVALFLFALLMVVHGAFSQGVSVAGADRLVVVNRVSMIQPLPLAYRDRLLRLPGVAQVTFANWFGASIRTSATSSRSSPSTRRDTGRCSPSSSST